MDMIWIDLVECIYITMHLHIICVNMQVYTYYDMFMKDTDDAVLFDQKHDLHV